MAATNFLKAHQIKKIPILCEPMSKYKYPTKLRNWNLSKLACYQDIRSHKSGHSFAKYSFFNTYLEIHPAPTHDFCYAPKMLRCTYALATSNPAPPPPKVPYSHTAQSRMKRWWNCVRICNQIPKSAISRKINEIKSNGMLRRQWEMW